MTLVGFRERLGPLGELVAERDTVPMNPLMPPLSSTMYDPGGESPEPFAVACSIHPWMIAHLVSLKHPYMAASGAERLRLRRDLCDGLR